MLLVQSRYFWTEQNANLFSWVVFQADILCVAEYNIVQFMDQILVMRSIKICDIMTGSYMLGGTDAY